MSEKICLIYQPCGLGDILFLQKICSIYRNKGYKIIFPVVYEYEWLNNYIDGVEFISWGDKEKKLTHMDKLPENIQFPYKEFYDPNLQNIFTEDFVFLNFFKPINGRVMEFKYSSLNIDHNDWSNYLIFKRDIDKENKLYYDVLKLNESDNFVFVNRNYQMRPNVMFYDKISIDESHYNKKVVEMSIIDGFSIFDWCKVIEKASEIHTIETSLNYVLESNEMKNKITKNINLYHRYNNFNEVDYLFKLNWNYIKL